MITCQYNRLYIRNYVARLLVIWLYDKHVKKLTYQYAVVSEHQKLNLLNSLPKRTCSWSKTNRYSYVPPLVKHHLPRYYQQTGSSFEACAWHQQCPIQQHLMIFDSSAFQVDSPFLY